MNREDVLREGEKFHKLYYGPHDAFWRLNAVRWFGRPVEKCPFDLFVFQDIIFETKPDLIIETGTASGGSAAFMSGLCRLLGKGRVVTIDIREGCVVPDVVCLHGDSVAETTLEEVRKEIDTLEKEGRVMVILDSHHGRDHVLREMELYGDFVTIGNYMIVEDTNINGHPILPDSGPGPWEAVQAYLEKYDDFQQDQSAEQRFLFSFNPGGYLLKINRRQHQNG